MARAFAKLILCAALLVPACGGEPPPQEVSLEGELRQYFLFLGPNGKGDAQYYTLQVASGAERRLIFDEDPALAPGTRLHVVGLDLGDAVKVTRFETLALLRPPSSPGARAPAGTAPRE